MITRKDLDLYAIVNTSEAMDDPDYTPLEIVCEEHIEDGLCEYGKKKHHAQPYEGYTIDEDTIPICFICDEEDKGYVNLNDIRSKDEVEKAFGLVLV